MKQLIYATSGSLFGPFDAVRFDLENNYVGSMWDHNVWWERYFPYGLEQHVYNPGDRDYPSKFLRILLKFNCKCS